MLLTTGHGWLIAAVHSKGPRFWPDWATKYSGACSHLGDGRHKDLRLKLSRRITAIHNVLQADRGSHTAMHTFHTWFRA